MGGAYRGPGEWERCEGEPISCSRYVFDGPLFPPAPPPTAAGRVPVNSPPPPPLPLSVCCWYLLLDVLGIGTRGGFPGERRGTPEEEGGIPPVVLPPDSVRS